MTELASVSNSPFVSAQVEVNGKLDFVSLNLQPEIPACEEGFFCIQVMPAPIEVKISGIKQLQDECGSTVYYVENKGEDGVFESVSVIDNRTSQCQYFLPVADTEIRYMKSFVDQLAGEMVESESSFEGEGLVEINESFEGDVLSATFENGYLKLELRFCGGCLQHQFDLDWGSCQPSEWNGVALEECSIKVVRKAGFADQCRAQVIEEVQFDLNDLDQEYLLNIEGTRVLVL